MLFMKSVKHNFKNLCLLNKIPTFFKSYHSATKFTVYCSGNLHASRPEGCCFNTQLFEYKSGSKSKSNKVALLLHDLPGNALELKSLARKLSIQGFHVFAPSLPGSGYATGTTNIDEFVYSFSPSENADYLSMIIESLSYYKIDLLVGVGLSSYTACLLTAHLSKQFKHVCLVDPPDVSPHNLPPRITANVSNSFSTFVAFMWQSNFIFRAIALNCVGLKLKRHNQYLKSLITERLDDCETDWRRLGLAAIIAEYRKDTKLLSDACGKFCFQLSASDSSSDGTVTLIRSPGGSLNDNQSGSQIFGHWLQSFKSVQLDVNNESQSKLNNSRFLLVNVKDGDNLIRPTLGLNSYNDEHLSSAIIHILNTQMFPTQLDLQEADTVQSNKSAVNN